MPFEEWEPGEELFVNMDRDADLLDRDVRVWAEECDQMQGIQVFTGGNDAWGGFASKYVESLRDEYGKRPIWTWSIEEEQGKGQRAKQLLKTVNSARTMNEMATHASLYIPISIPPGPLPEYVQLNRDSQWHTSALLSAALESMTLPSRLRPDTQKRGLLGDIEAALNVNGNQRIAQLECSIMDPEVEPPKLTNNYGTRDDRAPSRTSHTMIEEDGKSIKSYFNISLSDGDLVSSSSVSRTHRASEHTFGAVQILRGRNEIFKAEDTDDDGITYARKRRRFAGLTVVERFVSSVFFRLLNLLTCLLIQDTIHRSNIHS